LAKISFVFFDWKNISLRFIKKRNEMTTMIIKDSSPQAKQFIKLARMLPFATVIESKRKNNKRECNVIFGNDFPDELKKSVKSDISKFKVAFGKQI